MAKYSHELHSKAYNTVVSRKFRPTYGVTSGLRALKLSFLGAKRNARGQRIGDVFELAKLLGHEIGPGLGRRSAFARDLNYADYFLIKQNWRAHNFLNWHSALVFRNRDGLKNGGVRHAGEMIGHFGAPFADSAHGQRIRTGQRNLAHALQVFRHDKSQKSFVRHRHEDGYFVGLHHEMLGDHLHGAMHSDKIAGRAAADDFVRPFLQFVDEFVSHSYAPLASLARGFRARWSCLGRVLHS